MNETPRARARLGACAFAAAAAAAGVLVGSPAHAALPLPTITAVSVAGSTTNKVVTAGTTIVITGTGFSGMTDNAAVSACSTNAPAAYPAQYSGCSQVRFNGIGATSTANFTPATRYTVVNDTTIYATVPTISAVDGATGGPVAGTGSVKVQVLNTTGTGTSSGLSSSTASELFYRKPLTANVPGTPTVNPLGGGSLVVGVTGGIATLTSTTLAQEKITAYVYSVVSGSPQVASANVTFNDGTDVNVVMPPGEPAGDFVGVMLVHDGIPGVADVNSVTYPAVITQLNLCAADQSAWIAAPTSTLPTCTGTATAPTSGTASFKVTGKGFTGATTWNFAGVGGTVPATCLVVSDTLAYCALTITTPPPSGVASVTFTPVAQAPATVAVQVPTAGSILIYGNLV
jgi:hypothetical protein